MNISTYKFIKKFFDINFSILVLICSLPIFLLCSLFIKFEDGGPFLFKQIRVGKNGKRFLLYILSLIELKKKKIKN